MDIHVGDDHAKSTWVTVNIGRNDKIETVLKVETDLELHPDSAGSDGNAFSGLQMALRGYLEEHPHIDRAEIVQIRPVA